MIAAYSGAVNHYVVEVSGKVRRAIVCAMKSGVSYEIVEEDADEPLGYYVISAGFGDAKTVAASLCRAGFTIL